MQDEPCPYLSPTQRSTLEKLAQDFLERTTHLKDVDDLAEAIKHLGVLICDVVTVFRQIDDSYAQRTIFKLRRDLPRWR